MAIVHSVTLADGAGELHLSWSPDGAAAVAEGDGGQTRLELAREDIFAICQWAGTALNQSHFNEDQAAGD